MERFHRCLSIFILSNKIVPIFSDSPDTSFDERVWQLLHSWHEKTLLNYPGHEIKFELFREHLSVRLQNAKNMKSFSFCPILYQFFSPTIWQLKLSRTFARDTVKIGSSVIYVAWVD